MAGIIWLASYQKSGNTWVRAFLANLLHNPDRPLPINELPNFALGDGFLIHFEALSGKPASEPNLPLAHQTIDTLEMIEEKTRGNLTEDEAKLLQSVLYELRMGFVRAQRGA